MHYYFKLQLQSLYNRRNPACFKGRWSLSRVSLFRYFPSRFQSADISLGGRMRLNHFEPCEEVLEPLHIMCNSSQSKKIDVSYNWVLLNDHIKQILLNFNWAARPPRGIILVWWGRYSACNNTCLRQWKLSDLWISYTDTNQIMHYCSKIYQIQIARTYTCFPSAGIQRLPSIHRKWAKHYSLEKFEHL